MGDDASPDRGYSIELPLSPESRSTLKGRLEGAEGKWREEDFSPHLSLAVIREPVEDVAGLVGIVEEFSRTQGSFRIRLSSLGVFPGRRPVLTLMPAHHERLLRAHHRLVETFPAAGVSPIPYYRKHRWSPHVTLMMGRPKREVAAAVEILSRVRWTGDYVLDRVELVEFHPAKKLLRLRLEGETGENPDGIHSA